MAVIFSGRKETAKEDLIKKDLSKKIEETPEKAINNNLNSELQNNETTVPVKKTSKPWKKKAVKATVKVSAEESIELPCSKDRCGPEGPKGNDDSVFVTGLDKATGEDHQAIEFIHLPNPTGPVFIDTSGSHGLGAIFDEEEPERDDEESEED